MNEMWETTIKALGGYTVILCALFWWIGKRLLQNLLAKEKGKIQKEINKDNAELLLKNQKEIQEIKSQIDIKADIRKLLSNSFSDIQSKVFENKLKYIEDLWIIFLKFRDSIPGELMLLDVLDEQEYNNWIKDFKTQSHINESSIEGIIEIGMSIENNIEKVRPFVGEYLWFIFYLYRAFLLRLMFLLYQDQQKYYWKSDKLLLSICESALSNDEYKIFKEKKFESIRYFKTMIEIKFLQQIKKIINGQSLIEEEIEKVSKIYQLDIPSQINKDIAGFKKL